MRLGAGGSSWRRSTFQVNVCGRLVNPPAELETLAKAEVANK